MREDEKNEMSIKKVEIPFTNRHYRQCRKSTFQQCGEVGPKIAQLNTILNKL